MLREQSDVVRAVRAEGADYGRSNGGGGRSVLVEFVSANPNGPLHVGHGRGAAFGDVLASLLEWSGWRVTRECYVNDSTNSVQMVLLGRSLYARYRQALGREAAMPEDGYDEEYVTEMARSIADREGDRFLALPEEESTALFADLALKEMLAQQREELRAFGVEHDVWFSEQALHTSGAVAEALSLLRASPCAYEADGALWLRSTAFGDESDRVLVRGTGAATYLAADTAYHRDKRRRGFDRAIDVWGADHHGYVTRTKAAVQALGIEPDWLTIVIYQPVRVLKGGEVVRTSKRAGDVIPLADVLAEVGRDAARLGLLARGVDSILDLDVDLAREQSGRNLLYTVQQAHALLSGILREAEAAGVTLPAGSGVDLSLLGEEAERALVCCLADFPDEVVMAAETLEPHRMALFVRSLAEAIRAFSDACGVVGEGTPARVRAARLALVDAVRIVMGNALGILGVRAE